MAYASAGAEAGYGLLWTCTLSFPLMVAVQINADRTGLATGRSLGELAAERFGGAARRVFGCLLAAHVLANTLVIAADLIAVGEGVRLLAGGPSWLWALGAGFVITALLLSGSFSTIANVLKLLCLALAVLGATLPPYVFFWQSAHRLEELREEELGGDDPVPLDRRSRRQARRKRRTTAVDVVCGMTFAIVVMLAVIVATAASGAEESSSAADVAQALEPVAGGGAKGLFAAGFVAAGMVVSLVGVDPIRLLVAAASLNGATSAPLLAAVMLISGDRALLARHRPGRLRRALGCAAVAFMSAAALGGLASALTAR